MTSEHKSRVTSRASGSERIPRTSLTSAVADRLREMIIRGDIQEGEQLRQDAIAGDLEVSRIPVREALRQLEAEGLIKIVTHRGAVVSSLSSEEIEELFEMRAVLECHVLALSIPHLTESDFKEAEAILETYEKALWKESDVGSWGRLNSQFHATLYSRANRPHFMSIIRQINNNGDRYTRLQLYLTRSFERAKREHRMLVELCRKRDVKAACELLEQHIQTAGGALKELLEQRRAESQSKHPGRQK
ncbi:MAG TPA: GntR family transcriptional regulator [Candidatus Acidoferrales bacterium]|nr:GntR family transcriptional regulator [Candidatus Acidoferrales bacterium]